MGTAKSTGIIAVLPSSHWGDVNIPACHSGCIPDWTTQFQWNPIPSFHYLIQVSSFSSLTSSFLSPSSSSHVIQDCIFLSCDLKKRSSWWGTASGPGRGREHLVVILHIPAPWQGKASAYSLISDVPSVDVLVIWGGKGVGVVWGVLDNTQNPCHTQVLPQRDNYRPPGKQLKVQPH